MTPKSDWLHEVLFIERKVLLKFPVDWPSLEASNSLACPQMAGAIIGRNGHPFTASTARDKGSSSARSMLRVELSCAFLFPVCHRLGEELEGQRFMPDDAFRVRRDIRHVTCANDRIEHTQIRHDRLRHAL